MLINFLDDLVKGVTSAFSSDVEQALDYDAVKYFIRADVSIKMSDGSYFAKVPIKELYGKEGMPFLNEDEFYFTRFKITMGPYKGLEIHAALNIKNTPRFDGQSAYASHFDNAIRSVRPMVHTAVAHFYPAKDEKALWDGFENDIGSLSLQLGMGLKAFYLHRKEQA